jgi:hypothetical protein
MCNQYSLSEFWGFFPVQAFLRAMLLCIGQDWTCHYFLLHVCSSVLHLAKPLVATEMIIINT